jgi:hypothetical protein
MTQLSRRSLVTGLISLVAAPSIVRATNLMPVKVMVEQPIGFINGIPIYEDYKGPHLYFQDRFFWTSKINPQLFYISEVAPGWERL